jgi:nucleotide-binding universal stress UspA family protein
VIQTSGDPAFGHHAPSGRVIQTSGDPAFGHHAPAALDFGRVVAIAWRQDEHTAKAIVPALRYIRQAERVFLLAGLRKDGAPGLPEVLREHAVRAELHVMPIRPGGFGRALLARAHDLAVDLLVMGAYAHSPLYNLVHGWLGYGGVTRFMLEHADLPVLMRY